MVFDPESDIWEWLFTVFPKVFKGGIDQVHIIQEWIIDFPSNFLIRFKTVYINTDNTIKEPFHVPVTGTTKNQRLIDLKLRGNVIDQGDSSFTLNPRANVGRVQELMGFEDDGWVVEEIGVGVDGVTFDDD